MVKSRGVTRLAAPGLVSVMLVYVMVKTAVLAGLSGTQKTGCSGEKSIVLHVPNPSCAGKRFDHCGSDYHYKAKHTDLVKAFIPEPLAKNPVETALRSAA